jgi:hypothetical protein
MEIARFCQATGITLKELDRRDASDGRARKMNRLFYALRQKGWSLDRIAKATSYSARGVASNLERFTQSAFQEAGGRQGGTTLTRRQATHNRTSDSAWLRRSDCSSRGRPANSRPTKGILK